MPACPSGTSGTLFPFLTLGVGRQGHCPPRSMCECVHVRVCETLLRWRCCSDLRTAGRYLAAPQGAPSEGVQGLGFCPVGVTSGAASVF